MANAKKGWNKSAFLEFRLFEKQTAIPNSLPTRDGYGDGLVLAGKKDKRIVVLCADLTESTRSLAFKLAFPDRFIQLGVSEQSLASIAAGMSLAGKIPFISSYAAFSPGRNWEQIRTTIALNEANVKIAGAHAGVSVGPDGATHQMTEDIALMRVLPNMRVIVPCDVRESRKATLAAASVEGPVYLRFAREKTPVFTTEKTPFRIGRAEVCRFGSDLTMIASGPILFEALIAAERLSRLRGIESRVINCHTIKPLDIKLIVQAAKETGAIVTAEEAQIAGGLGGAIAELLSSLAPVPIERIGLHDHYGESGSPDELLKGFGLTAPYIMLAAERVFKRKRGEKVSAIPEYKKLAEAYLADAKQRIMEEAILRTPQKWGGRKKDGSLKSRQP